MRSTSTFLLPLCLLAAGIPSAAACRAADTGKPAYTDPAKTDADFPFQGEYDGTFVGTVDGKPLQETIGAQVVALGDGQFSVTCCRGGLPTKGSWKNEDPTRCSGTRTGDTVAVEGLDWFGVPLRGVIDGSTLKVLTGDGTFDVGAVLRKTSGVPFNTTMLPPGAVVLCDGPGPVDETETFIDARLADDGLLMPGATTRQEFGDALWHVDFRLPYQPFDRGQARGNSGIYLHGCYEVQVLDSFGAATGIDRCGAIYGVAAPKMNMCRAPLTWQSYEIDFTAPRFEAGKKVKNARVTVRHAGRVIHEDVEIPSPTRASPRKEEAPTGPLHLQDHGNPVRYGTIWVLPKK